MEELHSRGTLKETLIHVYDEFIGCKSMVEGFV